MGRVWGWKLGFTVHALIWMLGLAISDVVIMCGKLDANIIHFMSETITDDRDGTRMMVNV